MQSKDSDKQHADLSPHHGGKSGGRLTSASAQYTDAVAHHTDAVVQHTDAVAHHTDAVVHHTENENTVARVFRHLNKRLLHLARGILGNDMEAEDAVQDAFCKMWERREQMSDEREVAAVITTTVRHTSIDALRKQTHHATIDIDEVEEQVPVAEDTKTDAEERFRRVEALIESELSPTARHVLRRREYDGADFDTIAQELDLQPTAVRMHLSRARQKIMNAYLEQQRHET